jgi:hypothetical protein
MAAPTPPLIRAAKEKNPGADIANGYALVQQRALKAKKLVFKSESRTRGCCVPEVAPKMVLGHFFGEKERPVDATPASIRNSYLKPREPIFQVVRRFLEWVALCVSAPQELSGA